MVCHPTVQVRRNTEAAAAEARKAMLAGGQAHNAPARAAGQADVVAASQGITKSLLRSRQLMAQVGSSFGKTCSIAGSIVLAYSWRHGVAVKRGILATCVPDVN